MFSLLSENLPISSVTMDFLSIDNNQCYLFIKKCLAIIISYNSLNAYRVIKFRYLWSNLMVI